jgi:hypothetical protein
MVPGSRGRGRVVSRGRLSKLGKVGDKVSKRGLWPTTRDRVDAVPRVRKARPRGGVLDIKLPDVREKLEPASNPAGGGLSELRKAAGMTERECRAADLLKVTYARFSRDGSSAGNLEIAPLMLHYGSELVPVMPVAPAYRYSALTRSYGYEGGNLPSTAKKLEFAWGSLGTGPYFGCSFRALQTVTDWGPEFKEAEGLKDLFCEEVVERMKKAKGLVMAVCTDQEADKSGWAQKAALARLVKHGFKDVAQAPSTHNLGARNMTGSKGENDYNVHLLVGDWR